MIYLVIGAAGVLGSLLRYYLSLFVGSWWVFSFPLGTLLTNYLGCLILGYFSSKIENLTISPVIKAGIGTGLIGSFTTFSTFSVETIGLINRGYWLITLLYISLSLFGGLLMAWGGLQIGKKLDKEKQRRKDKNEFITDK